MSQRIALDLQAAQTASAFRGIGRYSLELARALARVSSGDELYFGLDATYPEHALRMMQADLADADRSRWIPYWYPGPRAHKGDDKLRRRLATEMVAAAYAPHGLDVLHVSSLFEGFCEHACPLGGLARNVAKTASVTVYDFIPLRFPEHYLDGTGRSAYRDWYSARIEDLSRFDHFLCISEATRVDAIDFLGIAPDKAVNIGGGVSPLFRPASDLGAVRNLLSRRFGLESRYVLYTGNDDYRKNTDGALAAFARLPASIRNTTRLVLNQIGDRDRLAKTVRRLGLDTSSILITGRVSDSELLALMQGCDVFFFPSHFEGFGLPVLEAMACGVPVLCAANSSLLEVAPLPEMTFSSTDTAAASSLLEQALIDDAFRHRLIDAGLRAATQYCWTNVAKRAMASWREFPKAIDLRLTTEPRSLGPMRPKFALVTPLPPAQTGIADYAADLIDALRSHVDLTIFADEAHEPFCGIESYRTSELAGRRHEFDCVLYNIGNSPFHSAAAALLERVPGVVILHDFFLSSMIWHRDVAEGQAGIFRRVLEREHGNGALRVHDAEGWEKEVSRRLFPCSLSVLQHAEALISHSESSRQLAATHYPSAQRAPWFVLPMPIVATPVSAARRDAARKRLGVPDGACLVVSFGFVANTKLSAELVRAVECARAKVERPIVLRLVGDCSDSAYREEVRLASANVGCAVSELITGFVTTERYADYLCAADVAVQLRRNSRGETSKAQLDCMAHGVPCIVNRHGSLGEISGDAVLGIDENPSINEIAGALASLVAEPEKARELGQRGWHIAASRHSPGLVASSIVGIAHWVGQRRELVGCQRLVSAGADCVDEAGPGLESGEIWAIEHALRQASSSLAPRRILFDVSDMYVQDYGTGIHRVVREFARQLTLQMPPTRAVVELCAHATDGALRFVTKDIGVRIGTPMGVQLDASEDLPGQLFGDVLVLADSAWEAPERFDASLHRLRQNYGLAVAFVYDLIPITHPQHCVEYMPSVLANWLAYVVPRCDVLLCISKATANSLEAWIESNGIQRALNQRIDVIELGSDIGNAASPRIIESDRLAEMLRSAENGFVLMLGTIEPRKRHDIALEAFSLLWDRGKDVSLVVVGKPGWNTTQVQETLRAHVESGRRLHWISDATDEEVVQLLRSAAALLQASDAEGYGLPVIEAARFGTPLVLSDIPVFREVAMDAADYFSSGSAADLARVMEQVLMRDRSRTSLPQALSGVPLTWAEATRSLVRKMFGCAK